MQAFVSMIVTALLNWLKDFIFKKVKEASDENRAKEADKKNAEEAIADLKKPIDTSKSVEEQNKEAESAFDNFFNRFKR